MGIDGKYGNEIEKFIGFLKRSLALITPQDKLHKWDELIDHCLYAYRTSINRTIKTSPFELLYGRHDIMPQDLALNVKNNQNIPEKDNYKYILCKQLQDTYKDIYEKRLKEQQNYKSYYDLKHKEVQFQIGDYVLILFDVPKKGPLMPRWEGPYKIIDKVNPVTYKVENYEKLITNHVQRMKLIRNLRSNAHI